MPSSPPLIRFAHPMAVQSYLRHIGAPADRYVQHNCLPAYCEEPDVFVPVIKVWAFFAEAARMQDRLLGWNAGKYVGDHSLNSSLLQKLERAPTLLSAMQKLSQFIRSEGSDVDIGILERPRAVLLYTNYWGLRDMPGYHISQAYHLAVFVDLIRFFLGDKWTPGEIGLEAASFPRALQKRFPSTRFFVNQPLGYVVIPRKDLHHAACHEVSAGNGKRSQPVISDFDYVSKLRALMRAYLSEGYLTETIAADLMDTSVRTMKRRLAAENTSYRKLLDEVRFELAREKLRDPEPRIMDVARSVGFRDQANFTRMFRRIAGVTPGRYRRIVQAGGSGRRVG
jgi:AraC-like DNA-binding protein